MRTFDLSRRLVAEGVGTGFLLCAIVGSGIMAERLAGGNEALALLANTVSTGAVLVTLILTCGPISGAHLNPAVTLAAGIEGGLPASEMGAYVLVQIVGGVLGVLVANAMFELPIVTFASKIRAGPHQLLSEFVATFGLLSIIWGCSRLRSTAVPFAVGAYITAAFWFTSSTSFANPAVTLARSLSDSFAGIRLTDTPSFIGAQLLGAVAATLLFRWLVPDLETVAPRVIGRAMDDGS